MTRENIISRLAILAENNAELWRSEHSKHNGDDLSHQEETIFFAIQALFDRPAASEWRTDEPPKDGTWVLRMLIIGGKNKLPVTVKWLGDRWHDTCGRKYGSMEFLHQWAEISFYEVK